MQGSTNVQEAITEDGELSKDGLTTMICDTKAGAESAQQICRIRSIFYASFFGEKGQQPTNADGSFSTVPVDIVGSVAITSAGYGRRRPLTVDFELNMLLQPVAIDISPASTKTIWPTTIFGVLLVCAMPLLFH